MKEKLTHDILSLFTKKELSNRIIPANDSAYQFLDLDVQGIKVFFLSYEAHKQKEDHTHDELRLTLIRSGTMRMRMDDVAFWAKEFPTAKTMSALPK